LLLDEVESDKPGLTIYKCFRVCVWVILLATQPHGPQDGFITPIARAIL